MHYGRFCKFCAKSWPTFAPKLDKALVTLVLIYILVSLAPAVLAQDVYWNPANSVGSGHESMIQYAAWSSAGRAGMDVYYAGQTSAAECEANAITVRTAVEAEWLAAGAAAGFTAAEYTGFRGFTFVCPYGGYTLLLSPYWPVNQTTILHELACHGLRGYGHISDQDALCAGSAPEFAMISPPDVAYIGNSSDWPIVGTPDPCYQEYLPYQQVMIPEINGKRVILEYIGYSGGYQTFAKVSEHPSPVTCSNATYNGTEAILSDVEVYGLGYFTYVKFVRDGAVFKLAGAHCQSRYFNHYLP